MRVITGSARGTRLIAPEGFDVRPTSDKVKEAVFSAIQFDIEDAVVLDLFAGSGQMGIEALSRGAGHAVFVDSSQKSLKCVNENLTNTKLKDYADVVHRDSYDYIKLTQKSFDIIILDPPYRHGHIEKLLPFAAQKLSDNGYIICEYESEMEPPAAPEGTALRKTYRYGKINVSIFYKKSADDEGEALQE